MIDIHCHALNSIDDGARDLSESLEMLKLANENSISAIIFTPHIKCGGDIDEFINKRDALFDELKSAAKDFECPDLYKGAEVYADDDIFYAEIERLTINNTKYILVEFNFIQFIPQRIEKYFNEIKSLGLKPIFAHPERYSYCQNDYEFLNYLRRMGVLFQINASSLAGMGSMNEFLLAKELINKQMASFIGSDGHSPRGRTNELLKMASAFPSDLDAQYLDYVLNETPLLLLGDEEIPDSSIGQIAKQGNYRRFH